MLRMIMIGIAIIAICLFLQSFIPNSESQYLEIKDKTTKLNGTHLLIEAPISPSKIQTEMEGVVYIYYADSSLFNNDCQIKVKLFSTEHVNALASCTSGESSCDIDFNYKRKNKKLVLSFEDQPISPLKLVIRSEPTNELGQVSKCGQSVKEILLKPKWKRLSQWQEAFLR